MTTPNQVEPGREQVEKMLAVINKNFSVLAGLLGEIKAREFCQWLVDEHQSETATLNQQLTAAKGEVEEASKHTNCIKQTHWEELRAERDTLRAQLEQSRANYVNDGLNLEVELVLRKERILELEAQCALKHEALEILGAELFRDGERKNMVFPIYQKATASNPGNTLVERVKGLEKALQRISDYPVHSEPVGGAVAMQDIALAALTAPTKATDE